MRRSGWILAALMMLSAAARGSDWHWQHPLPTGSTLRGVWAVDHRHAWAVGEFGTILCTADGGRTWQPQCSGTAVDLHAVVFVNPWDGWAAGGESG